jgi:hypothetical protein
MNQITYTLNGLNREALNHQLAQAFGPLYAGFADRETRAGFVVTINLTSEAAPADLDRLNQLMAQYDPTVLTPAQQAQKQREQKLAEARRDYKGGELNPADYAGENALIQALARKLAWLEQEIADLRGS